MGTFNELIFVISDGYKIKMDNHQPLLHDKILHEFKDIIGFKKKEENGKTKKILTQYLNDSVEVEAENVTFMKLKVIAAFMVQMHEDSLPMSVIKQETIKYCKEILELISLNQSDSFTQFEERIKGLTFKEILLFLHGNYIDEVETVLNPALKTVTSNHHRRQMLTFPFLSLFCMSSSILC